MGNGEETMTRISMPFAQWPETDRAAWQSILTRGDLFDEAGSCSSWSEATRTRHFDRYGGWLSFLARKHPTDLMLAPPLRVTEQRVTQYVEDMSDRPDEYLDWRVIKKLAPASQAMNIWTLDAAMRAFAPSKDWAWLRRAARRLTAQAEIDKSTPYLGVSAMELSRWALRQIAAIEIRNYPNPKKRALAHRNAFAVALLIHCPVRRRAFCALDVIERVQRTSRGYVLRFGSGDMKDGRARVFPLHRRLTAPMESYLHLHRPVLLQGSPTTALWITERGKPMKAGSLRFMISELTKKGFGKRLSVHDFRRIAATSIAEFKPERAGIIRDVLGHSTMDMADKHYIRSRGLEAMNSHQEVVESVIERAKENTSKRGKKSLE